MIPRRQFMAMEGWMLRFTPFRDVMKDLSTLTLLRQVRR